MNTARVVAMAAAVHLSGLLLGGCATTGIEGATCAAGDCMNGTGELELPGGGRYQGAFSDGLYWGMGVLKVGQIGYEGEWSNGLPDGSGTLSGSNYVYSGRFDSGEFSGAGELVLSSGIAFRGGFDNGVPREGKLVLENGGTFGGKVRSAGGELVLDGQLQKPDGTVSIGTFKLARKTLRIPTLDTQAGVRPDGVPRATGRHRLEHPDGTREEVAFDNGKRDGRGRLELPNGRTVVLAWKQGKTVYRAPGPKTIQAQTQSRTCRLDSREWVYFGDQCRNGLAHGNGIAYSRDGEKTFRGRFEQGDFAEGELVTLAGAVRSGEWEGFELHGEGREFSDGALVYRGEFREGERHGKGLCVQGERGARCEYYEGKRVDQAHKMRQLSQSDLARAGDGRSASQAAMEALRESSEERAEQWSERVNKHARKSQSLQGPGLLSQALRVGADIAGRMEDGGDGYSGGILTGSNAQDDGGSSLSSQLQGSSRSSGSGDTGLADYIMQTGVELAHEMRESQARTNRLIKQENRRRAKINRERRRKYERQQELRKQRQQQRRERIQRQYKAAQQKIARRHRMAEQNRRQREQQEDSTRKNVEPTGMNFSFEVLPAATYDPDTGGYRSPGEPRTITVGGGNAANQRGGTQNGGSGASGPGGSGPGNRGAGTGSASTESARRSASSGNSPEKEQEYREVPEALAVCWESEPGNDHWFCSGPGQETLSAWDTEEKALELSGCDSPRQDVEGVHISRDRSEKWAEGVSANLHYCDAPLAEYSDDIHEEFDFRIPPSVPRKTYQCEATGDDGWSTRPHKCK